jgi:hypothetical protein
MPEIYLQESVDNIKAMISLSLDHLTERIIEVFIYVNYLNLHSQPCKPMA